MKISQGTLQYRVRAYKIARRLVVKGHSQLNQSLPVPPRRLLPAHRAPEVFKNFMRFKKAGAIKQVETAIESQLIGPKAH
jgi:hypothetical protein